MTYDPPNYQSDSSAAIPVSVAGGSFNVTEALPVGTGQFATTQATMGTSAELIVAARTGTSGTGRAAVTILNPLSVNLYVGNAGVTTATGFLVEAGGGSVTLQTQAAVYGCLASGTGTVAALETF